MEEQRVVPKKRQDKISMHTSCDSICMPNHDSNIDLHKKTVKKKENKTRQKSLCVFFSLLLYALYVFYCLGRSPFGNK